MKYALYLQESAEKRDLPKANGKQIRFLRPNTLAAITSPLTEGNPTAASGQSWVTTPILATPLQYGGYISFSDRLELEAYDNIVEQMHKILGLSRLIGQVKLGKNGKSLDNKAIPCYN